MKYLLKRPGWVRITLALAFAVTIVGFIVRRPLLVAYHRDAMVSIWQTELGISPRNGLIASVRNSLGAAPLARNSQAAVKAFSHREALLSLGFFTKRTFSLTPVSVGTHDYQQLCNSVAAQTGQQPTAQFEYDKPASPSNVLGLTIYATPEDMLRWEQFVAKLTAK